MRSMSSIVLSPCRKKKTQQKNTSCTPRFDSCNPVITGVTVPLSPGVSSSRWQAWMNRRHRIFPGYERLYLCVQWAKWRFHLTKDAPGMIPDLLDTQKNHTTMKHLNVSGGVGEVLECLQREWTMRQIETEWHVALNSAEVKAPRTRRWPSTDNPLLTPLQRRRPPYHHNPPSPYPCCNFPLINKTVYPHEQSPMSATTEHPWGWREKRWS